MNEKKLLSLIENSDETDLVEFKVNYFDKDGIGEYISALANSAAMRHEDAAYMIWGVEDSSHDIVGTSFTLNKTIEGEPYEHYLSRGLNPCKYDVEEFRLKGKRVVAMTIFASAEKITEFYGERFIRIGSSKERLRKHPYLESKLWNILGHNEFSLVKDRSHRQNLSFRIFKIYLDENSISYTNDNFDSNFDLLTDNGDYNYLAFLLSDQNDITYKIVKYDGPDKFANIIMRRMFNDRCILKSIDDVIDYLQLQENTMRTYFDSVSMRHDEYLFDIDAVSEAWKNACVHNDYSRRLGPTMFIFTDHLEIFSHGSPLSIQSKSNFLKGKSRPLNPELAKIFMRVNKYDESGKGVKTILRSYDPSVFIFDEDDQDFIVSIPFNEKLIGLQKDEGIEVSKDDAASARKKEMEEINQAFKEMPKKSKLQIEVIILEEIRKNPKISLDALAKIAGKSKKTIQRAISSMKEVRHSGSNRAGYWEIVDE